MTVRSRLVILQRGRHEHAVGDPVAALGTPDWQRSRALSGLEEHLVLRDVEDALGLRGDSSAGAVVLRYGFSEMLNNAIEHSEGTEARMSAWSTETSLAFEVSDDGVGVFEKVRRQWGLAGEMEAILELSKGKRTSEPERHSGEGIFFTSRAVDAFRLEANGLSWTVDNVRDDQAVGISRTSLGTRVSCVVARESDRTLQSVFERYTRDLEFVRTRPRVKLAESGGTFMSRSEARRLTAGLEKFAEVELDFADVDIVGQGFVDEVFRVWSDAESGDALGAGEHEPRSRVHGEARPAEADRPASRS